MKKTVQVVDEAGIRYQATYPRRAAGLVKNGRARFIDENTICLASPPNRQNKISEDEKMTNTEHMINDSLKEQQPAANSKYSLEYALEMLEKLAAESSHIREAIAAVASMESEPTIENGGTADEKARAVAEIVRCREATNQKLIAFYEKMAEDCKPQNEAHKRAEFLNWVQECIRTADHRVGLPDFAEMAELYKSI